MTKMTILPDEAVRRLDESIDLLLGLDPRASGWHAVRAAVRLLELSAYALAGSETSVRVARLILMAAELERMLEDPSEPL